jgi:dsRNA-specific ribonuclease
LCSCAGRSGRSAGAREESELFGLQPSALGLLSQALIHKSWAFEHPKAAKDARQRDNAALAFVGSCALEYEYVAAVARAAIASEDPGKQGIISQRNSAYAEAFRITGMADGLLLGTGQARTTNITTALASDSFQAVFAAVSAGRGFPATLMDSWPAPWSAARELIAPSQARPEDARSRLESVTGRMRLPVSYEYDHQGQEHVRLYRCTITLESEATGKSVTVARTFAPSKGEAKDRAAEQVLAVFDSLTEGRPASAGEATRDIARFLAAHQAAVSARPVSEPGEPASPEVSPS